MEDDPTLHVPIAEAIDQYPSRFAHERHRTPSLSAGHPLFQEYAKAFENDRRAFVRRLIPDAIAAYEQKTGEDPGV